MQDFHQAGPRLVNQFEEDVVLKSYLQRVLPAESYATVAPDLRRFGERVVSDVLAMAKDAEAHPPRLVNYDPWGRRIDEIETSAGWQKLDGVSAEEGLVALGYERPLGPLSRVYQFAKLYLFDPSSAIYSCPLAMTDGAARLIEVHGDGALRKGAFRHLTSRDPKTFWTSGQWMTERQGGSDVSRTSTRARPVGKDSYLLYGDKWFTSATTSQMAMTLARIEAADGTTVPGSRGLSLFYLETKDEHHAPNGIRINRLKDKLGTKALPTAELTLDGAQARLVGRAGEGVRTIATLFNVTRIYNSVCAVAKMRRAVVLARDFARRREAFGKFLSEHPLHVETLARMELETRAGFHLVFSLAERLGRVECGPDDKKSDEASVLRLLTPIAKMFTGKQAVAVTSEALECFGGAGYIEDTGLPALLRDAQVLSIWEGTTNVLSLDVLRAIEKDRALPPFLAEVERMASSACRHTSLSESAEVLSGAAKKIAKTVLRLAGLSREIQEASARDLAYGLGKIYAGATLIEQAAGELERSPKTAASAVVAAQRWCVSDLAAVPFLDAGHLQCSRELVFGKSSGPL